MSNNEAWIVSVLATIGWGFALWLIGTLMYEYGVLWILGWIVGLVVLIGGGSWIIHGVIT